MDKNIRVYALSTCGWCHRTVKWLEDNKVDCDIIYVDKLEGGERESIVNEMKKHNPMRSFPTIVIDDGRKVIVGYKPDDLATELL